MRNQRVNNPFFSIVVINFNYANYLEENIKSIINQSCIDYELIIIDGGSNDKSVEIIKKYQSYVSYWVSEKDKGPADALNKGFRVAKGEYIYYLNSDDTLLGGNVLLNIKAFIQQTPSFDFYYGHGVINKDNTIKKAYSTKWSLNMAAAGVCRIFQQSHFIKRLAYLKTAGFNTNNNTCWDYELLVDISLNGGKSIRHNIHTAVFRIHSDSITGSNSNNKAYLADKKRIRDKIIGIKNMQLNRNILFFISILFDLKTYINILRCKLFSGKI